MSRGFLLALCAVLMCCGPMTADTTNPGLFFNIQNDCSGSVQGFAVGDKICFLQIDAATFMRAVFQGNMSAGQSKQVMTCAGSDGNGIVLFVPPVSSGAQAVQMTVKPNETVAIPSSFCSPGQAEGPEVQLRHEEGEGEG